ncbi:low-complexity protein [Candidatus Scalindua japonica]|uniref:Low-complexity protein n=1 Tax=Candidatus Scalindua japonica TaxID=1284222 RepID=A0A286U365_9BACT|nr:pentapeptide repeat-containing protein [Candidatus Scalindua japonica]GAX62565.1 low-complexity protein [Candidatus Scalindua japonica]
MIDSRNSWLLNAALIVSFGSVLMLSVIHQQMAYGYEEADVQRLINTNNCRDCDLQSADLSSFKLDRAFLRYAEMQKANLEDADLAFADFIAANMRESNLKGANLEGANFMHTKLEGANLSETNLQRTDMRDARLSGTNLSNADVQGADFMWAKGLTNKQKAYLRKNGAKNVPE